MLGSLYFSPLHTLYTFEDPEILPCQNSHSGTVVTVFKMLAYTCPLGFPSRLAAEEKVLSVTGRKGLKTRSVWEETQGL